MKISIGQFFGLVVLAALIYYFVSPWWGDQDRNHWINRFNNSIIDDGRVENGNGSKSGSADTYDPSGWN